MRDPFTDGMNAFAYFLPFTRALWCAQVCHPEHIADMYTSAWPHIVDMREVLRRVAETL